MKLTVLIIQGAESLVGSIKEIPSVITQGNTREEVMENIQDALELYLEDMRSEEDFGDVVSKEELVFA
ncbi:type II toxin-antitoxin system HicB family antitoxin [Dyadobacter sp. CY356]|uniref:type II toxin-antitoxin system HicB family antitoxin n=1 Tax=Dyadobacter sp. CY356 TaxID=2906442 RepID=UPI001F456A33|nr:type II toxin-antitoxin system HicB family antitoxin [Dyadobacter sp. CY356]MCF0058456.1 type II toxin-antitoxin system HicB family antitoxin [Dyadobacter sp. CY356]